MTRVRLTPKYSGERGASGNTPCTPEVAERLEARALAIAKKVHSSEFVDVTLMSIPRHTRFIIPGHKRRLVANMQLGRLKLIRSHVRTYGVDTKGKLFVGHEYDELHGTVFVPLQPLLQCTLDLGVLDGELMHALDAVLA